MVKAFLVTNEIFFPQWGLKSVMDRKKNAKSSYRLPTEA